VKLIMLSTLFLHLYVDFSRGGDSLLQLREARTYVDNSSSAPSRALRSISQPMEIAKIFLSRVEIAK